MKSKQKIYKILTVIFAIISISLVILYFFNYFKNNINIIMIFIGFTIFFSGLNQINIEQQIVRKGFINGNRILGICSLVLSMVIIISVIIKIV